MRYFKSMLFIAALVLFSGCATHSKIDASKFTPPKTVVLVDIPKMKDMALIGVYTTTFDFHFSASADPFFVEPPDSANPAILAKVPFAPSGSTSVSQGVALGAVGGAIGGAAVGATIPKSSIPGTSRNTAIKKGAAAGAVAGAIGGAIDAMASATQEKANLQYHNEVMKRLPDFDLGRDFMANLQKTLAAQGISVTLLKSEAIGAPYLFWPAKNDKGEAYRSGTYEGFPAVDADILMQVSPVAFYFSPGPLNAYRRDATVGVALFNGRTKQFLGRQIFAFKAPDSKFEYYSYDGLVNNLSEATPALKDALLSLIPQITDVVNGRTGTSQ